jgi:hypothetical protein
MQAYMPWVTNRKKTTQPGESTGVECQDLLKVSQQSAAEINKDNTLLIEQSP